MSILESFTVDAFGLSVVFLVLTGLSLCIKLISVFIGKPRKVESTGAALHTPEIPVQQSILDVDDSLMLFNVDEKTAALIMAIVSDKTEIPLSQLRFKSIRLMNQEVS